MTARDNNITLDRGHRRRLINFLLPYAGRVDVSLMGQVHEVVDHEPVFTDVIQASAIGPFIADRPL